MAYDNTRFLNPNRCPAFKMLYLGGRCRKQHFGQLSCQETIEVMKKYPVEDGPLGMMA
jgi:hypothetical protein